MSETHPKVQPRQPGVPLPIPHYSPPTLPASEQEAVQSEKQWQVLA